MNIEHAALYVRDLQRAKDFYTKYFTCTAGEMYRNAAKGFSSYFLSFDGGARLELMQQDGVDTPAPASALGYAHIAISLGSAAAVDALTARLAADGYTVAGEPRTTGDGYYESCILDSEGNRVELTV